MGFFENKSKGERFAFILRMAFVSFGFIGGVLTPNEIPDHNLPHPLLIFAIVPFMLLFVIGLQKINPMSAPVWEKGSWWINPFNFKQPLQFFHMGGYFFITGGVGLLASSVSQGQSTRYGMILVAMGIGVLVGIKICEKLFIRKNP